MRNGAGVQGEMMRLQHGDMTPWVLSGGQGVLALGHALQRTETVTSKCARDIRARHSRRRAGLLREKQAATGLKPMHRMSFRYSLVW